MRGKFDLMKLICFCALCCLCMFGTRVYAAENDDIFADDATVKVYASMSEDGGITASLIDGSGFEILDTQTDEDGDIWYRIKTDFGAQGYVKSDEMERLRISDRNDAGSDASAGQQGELNVLETINFREQPSTDSEVIARIEHNTRIPYFEEYVDESGEVWYQVSYENMTGYVTGSAVAIVQQTQPDEDIQTQPDEAPPERSNARENVRENVQSTGQIFGTKTVSGIAAASKTETGITSVSVSDEKKHHIKFDMLAIVCIIGDIFCAVMLALLLKKIYKTVQNAKNGSKIKKQEKMNNVYR